MPEDNPERRPTPEEWREARKYIFGRGLYRMTQGGAGEDPARFWGPHHQRLLLTSWLLPLSAFLLVIRLTRSIPNLMVRYTAGVVVAWAMFAISPVLYGVTLMFLMGLRKNDVEDAEDQSPT